MTKKQYERAASILQELGVATMIGSCGDLFFLGSRRAFDVLVIALALAIFGWSLKLTGRSGGPTL